MTTDAVTREAELATEPLRNAGPSKGIATGFRDSLRDIYGHRELLNLLVRREIKARYKDSSLGLLWSLGRPLAMLAIYYIALGQFLGAARGVPQFAIFIYSGLTAWGFYSEAVIAATSTIVTNAGLVKKVYLPREIFPLASMGSALFNFAIQLVILLLATLLARSFPLGTRWAYFLVALAILLVLGTAFAFLLSAVNVYLRDVQYLVEIFLMIFFWASPVVYPWHFVHTAIAQSRFAEWADLVTNIYLWNPATLAVLGFQKAFWVAGDGEPQVPDLRVRMVVVLFISVALLWVAQRVFARLQANFAQEL